MGSCGSEQRISPPAFLKEEGAALLSVHVEEEEHEVPIDLKEERVSVHVSNLPPTHACAGREADEDEPPERSHLLRRNPSGDQCEGPPPDHLEVPRSERDDDPKSDARREGEAKRSKSSRKKATRKLPKLLLGAQPERSKSA